MKIVHRIGFSSQRSFEQVLEKLGIRFKKVSLPGGKDYVGFFDIEESDRRWDEISEIVERKQLSDVPITKFSPSEVRTAEWVRLLPGLHFGYPQPDEGWKGLTYENGCPKCSVGFRQKASYRIAMEPRLGKNDFAGLYWTGALFATMRVFEAFDSASFRGYEKWPPLIHSTGQPSTTIAQLFVVNETTTGLLGAKGLREETCAKCGNVRFDPVSRGMILYRREALPTGIDVVRSREWFGSGAFAFQETLVSRRLAHLILDQGWRGIVLHPLGLE